MPRNPNDAPWRRFLPELVVVIVGLVLVVGLWVHNNDDGGLGSGLELAPEQATTTTRSPSDSTPLIEDGAVSIEGDAKVARGLRDAVLGASDLPKGWTVSGTTGGPSPVCDDDPIGNAKPTALVRSSFLRSPGSDLIAGTVAAYDDAATARGVLEAVAAGTRSCPNPSIELELEDLADVGDEAVRISSSVTVGGAKIRNVALVARKGGRVAVIVATGDPIDEALVLRALRAQVGRL
jgi:hypothetical protein